MKVTIILKVKGLEVINHIVDLEKVLVTNLIVVFFPNSYKTVSFVLILLTFLSRYFEKFMNGLKPKNSNEIQSSYRQIDLEAVDTDVNYANCLLTLFLEHNTHYRIFRITHLYLC